MEHKQITAFESVVLNMLNKGYDTVAKMLDSWVDEYNYSEVSLHETIETLEAAGTIVTKNVGNETTVEYTKPLEGDLVMLDGELLLPVTIIEFPRDNCKYVCRGNWYKFKADFDVRRIIWNPIVENTNQSDLTQLIKSTVNKNVQLAKGKTNNIKQLSEYKQLVNKLVPYSDNIALHILTVGEFVTRVKMIMFQHHDSEDLIVQHNKCFVITDIDTKELIAELRKSKEERDWKNILLPKMLDTQDFIINGCEVPIKFQESTLTTQVVRFTTSANTYAIETLNIDSMGTIRVVDTDRFEQRTDFEASAAEYINNSRILKDILKRSDIELGTI